MEGSNDKSQFMKLADQIDIKPEDQEKIAAGMEKYLKGLPENGPVGAPIAGGITEAIRTQQRVMEEKKTENNKQSQQKAGEVREELKEIFGKGDSHGGHESEGGHH